MVGSSSRYSVFTATLFHAESEPEPVQAQQVCALLCFTDAFWYSISVTNPGGNGQVLLNCVTGTQTAAVR
jgi:hypothetical protein